MTEHKFNVELKDVIIFLVLLTAIYYISILHAEIAGLKNFITTVNTDLSNLKDTQEGLAKIVKSSQENVKNFNNVLLNQQQNQSIIIKTMPELAHGTSYMKTALVLVFLTVSGYIIIKNSPEIISYCIPDYLKFIYSKTAYTISLIFPSKVTNYHLRNKDYDCIISIRENCGEAQITIREFGIGSHIDLFTYLDNLTARSLEQSLICSDPALISQILSPLEKLVC